MRDEYDLSGAKRHPLAGTFKGKFNVFVHYDFTKSEEIDEDGDPIPPLDSSDFQPPPAMPR